MHTVPLEVALDWASPHARHRDRYYFDRVDLARDGLPADLGEQLQELPVGKSAQVDILFDNWQEPYRQSRIRSLPREQFRRRSKHPLPPVIPRTGRFYPRRFVSDAIGADNGANWPLRCLQAGEQALRIDLNHPLAGRHLAMQVTLLGELLPGSDQDDTPGDILATCTTNGPGMQASLPEVDTDFFTEEAFRRIDEAVDGEFYASPRLVQHLDATCRGYIQDLYARFMQPGMRVLDLMSSWVSHLPAQPDDLVVHGLGMNAGELQANTRLHDTTVQDLNQDGRLPFDEATFDAVICTASIEYLIRPREVIRDVARILKPGAPLVITFSDRWFPTKAIQLWSELYDFERLQLVTDYLRHSDQFAELASESLRGYPRPVDDPYVRQLDYSDPVFAVWGYRI
ncbi:methyltransferase domain-containing protein [Thiohalophilus thiocyanatoxydans]|uniref:Methyltransferase family protein n=1 Tax=Thiohalophilus thiocyanatoxydans TaxID=381308 RepID=A0A4R8IJM2_9GAMM|nr:methyltransferase domain-containing protein [Thiohalophilus thiocyanatoxydans]TDY00932.1 methyltransferase family protein [Thiohalophilus thiocyanatoxydans]